MVVVDNKKFVPTIGFLTVVRLKNVCCKSIEKTIQLVFHYFIFFITPFENCSFFLIYRFVKLCCVLRYVTLMSFFIFYFHFIFTLYLSLSHNFNYSYERYFLNKNKKVKNTKMLSKQKSIKLLLYKICDNMSQASLKNLNFSYIEAN